ncbi:hydroxyisourate hydrolase [Stigmatella sp. ncwal1]|uniref:5-hydroxyisourate hydrolase n=1 Tax=Stigmatella ashevillensis TaxID=2995309 RepID=A0ABT5DGR6_9BACT|nr:hydroxyisourate hydrolase [Stigmatella ashevillena]MDC0712845.1 hydroxyisourate hydrolase [Stigmatella ashevillena]
MSTLSTHVLDTQSGRPAAGVPITLETQTSSGEWRELARGTTNADGRVRDFLPAGTRLEPGTYRMTFHTGEYFRANSLKGFYPYVPVVFELASAEEHYHVPLLLSPFGFSTYRGS